MRRILFASVALSLLFTAGLLSGTYALLKSGWLRLDSFAPASTISSQTPRQSGGVQVSAPTIPEEPRTLEDRDRVVVETVKRVSPSVVSIVISRDLPKLRSGGFLIDPYDPFDPYGLLRPRGIAPQTPDAPTTEKQTVGGGSGFFVSSDGLILTNKHVVSYTDADYTVVLNDGTTLPAKVVARDPQNDIALIRVEKQDGKEFPALPLGDSSAVQLGQTVIAIGNALGEFQNSVSVGVVSGLSRSIVAGSTTGLTEQLSGVIQTDAAINPGNSGGPLLSIDGMVIGMNSAVAQGAQSIGFAISINDAKRDIESVQKTGKIIRAYLGVRYVSIDAELQEKNALPVKEGALILRGDTRTDLAVIPGSPADKAGLKENDIITKVDGTAVTAQEPLWRLISGKGVGDSAELTVYTKGEEKTVTVTLEAQPDTTTAPPSTTPVEEGGAGQ